jgi:hypothetical protein
MLRSSLCEAGLCGVVRVLTIGTADTGCLPLISNHQRPLDHLGVCKGTWNVRRQADRAGEVVRLRRNCNRAETILSKSSHASDHGTYKDTFGYLY